MKKKYIFNFLLFFFSFAISIFLIEFLLRINGSGPSGNFHSNRNDPTINEYDPNLGWKPKKGLYKLESYSKDKNPFTITINENGSRKSGNEPTNNLGEIAILGGSLTWGWGVSDKETFAWKLQKKITNYKVTNYAVGGYGTYQSLLKLEELLSKRNNIEYVICMFVPHHEVRNIGDEFWLRTLTKFSKRGYVSLPYASLGKDRKLLRHPPISYIKLPMRESSAIVNKIEKRIMKIKLNSNHQNRVEITKKILEKMSNLSNNNNIKFLFVNISSNSDDIADYLNFFKENQINYKNCNFESTEDLVVKGEGSHPNDKMHTKYSECIYSYLKI